jgi:hypothetical protein
MTGRIEYGTTIRNEMASNKKPFSFVAITQRNSRWMRIVQIQSGFYQGQQQTILGNCTLSFAQVGTAGLKSLK